MRALWGRETVCCRRATRLVSYGTAAPGRKKGSSDENIDRFEAAALRCQPCRNGCAFRRRGDHICGAAAGRAGHSRGRPDLVLPGLRTVCEPQLCECGAERRTGGVAIPL